MLPKSGDVLYIDKTASVQFRAPFRFRVIRRHDWTTYDGWVWLDGYELNADGDAVERRSIFVQIAGLRLVAVTVVAQARRTAAAGRVPRQPAPGDVSPYLRRRPRGFR